MWGVFTLISETKTLLLRYDPESKKKPPMSPGQDGRRDGGRLGWHIEEPCGREEEGLRILEGHHSSAHRRRKPVG